MEGSGPFPAGAFLLPSSSLLLAVLFEGDWVRESDLLDAEPDRAGVVGGLAGRAFACSSAMRASIAPRMRFGECQLVIVNNTQYITCRP